MAIESNRSKIPLTAELKITEKEIENNFCNDCLYEWCNNRFLVTYCTMKNKGFFECKSCMKKIT